MSLNQMNLRIAPELYKAFKDKCLASNRGVTEVVSELMALWSANPDLLKNAVQPAGASGLADNSGATEDELEDLEYGIAPDLATLRSNRAWNEVYQEQLAHERTLQAMDTVLGVAGSGEPNDPSCAAVDARTAKPRMIAHGRTRVALESERLKADLQRVTSADLSPSSAACAPVDVDDQF